MYKSLHTLNRVLEICQGLNYTNSLAWAVEFVMLCFKKVQISTSTSNPTGTLNTEDHYQDERSSKYVLYSICKNTHLPETSIIKSYFITHFN